MLSLREIYVRLGYLYATTSLPDHFPYLNHRTYFRKLHLKVITGQTFEVRFNCKTLLACLFFYQITYLIKIWKSYTKSEIKAYKNKIQIQYREMLKLA